MAISHSKSLTVSNFTGTVTVFNSAGSTTTMNATDNVQPSDWNTVHNDFRTIAGNYAGTSAFTATNVVYAGGSNVTLSISTAASAATISFNAGGGNQLSLGGNTSGTLGLISTGTALFAGGNNITLSQNGNSITISGANTGSAAQTNQTLGLYATGNTTLTTTTTADARSLSIQGAGIVSVGMSSGSLIISAPPASTLPTLSMGISALGNTTGTTGFASNQLVLAGGNNITLSGSTNAGSITVTISAGASGGGGGGVAVANSQTTYTSGTVGISGVGAVTVGSQTGNAFTISAPATSSLSATGFLNLSVNGSTISIGAGPLSFFATGNTTQSSSGTIDGRSITAIGYGVASVGVSNGSLIVSAGGGNFSGGVSSGGNTSGSTGTVNGQLVFVGGNNITLSQSTNAGSATITISAGASGGGGGVAVAASNTTFTSGTVVMSNGGGALTISSGAQSVIFSVPQTSSIVGTSGMSLSTNGSTISLYQQALPYFEIPVRNTPLTFGPAPQSYYLEPFVLNQPIGAYEMRFFAALTQNQTSGNLSASVSAGNATSGTVTAATTWNVFLFSRQSTGTNANSSNLVSFTSNSVSLSQGISASISWSTNASSATASYTTSGVLGYLQNVGSNGGTTTSSVSTSGSGSFSSTSTNANSFSTTVPIGFGNTVFSGARPLYVPMPASLTPGEYWMGMQFTSNSGSTNLSLQFNVNMGNGFIAHQMFNSQYAEIGQTATNNSTGFWPGLGYVSAGSSTAFSAMPITYVSNNSNQFLFFQMAGWTK